jgi:hypothetical protein
MTVQPDQFDFGAVPIGESLSLLLTVGNTGTGDLRLHSLATDTQEFAPNLDALFVPPGAERSVIVSFAPSAEQEFSDTLWLAGNDPAQPLVGVPLQGMGGEGTGVDDWRPRRTTLTVQPNPVADATALSFSLPAAASARLVIYDLRGRAVRTLVAGERLDSGDHRRSWDGRDDGGRPLASGVYFARLESSGKAVTRKVTLLR